MNIYIWKYSVSSCVRLIRVFKTDFVPDTILHYCLLKKNISLLL